MSYNLTAYELAVISGGFGIVGTLTGAFITYCFAIILAERNEKQTAVTKFKAEFIPILADVRHSCTNTEILIELKHVINSSMRKQSFVVEEFMIYVPTCKRGGYKETWDKYYQFASSIYSKSDHEIPRQAYDLLAPLLEFAK